MTTLSHKIAMRPKPSQANALARAAGCARFAWNWGLARWKELYEAGEKPSGLGLKKQFNAIKHEKFPWIGESPKDANQQPFTNLQAAFKRFFTKKAHYPKFKRKGQRDSFYLSNDKFKLTGKSVHIPHVGLVRLTEKLRFAGKIMSATVSRTASRWFISFQVEMPGYQRAPAPERVVGVDLGLKTAVVTSHGEFFEGPKPLKKRLKRLKLLQRSVSRKVKGSANRRKALMRVARLHARVRNIRQDFLNKTTTSIVRENQTIVLEDLNVSGMMRLRSLSREISDVGFYELRRQFEYKAPLHGGRVIVADRWFPSSKTCSWCGAVQEMPLGVRQYDCLVCGLSMDRDLNAAKNLAHLALWVASPNVKPVDSSSAVSGISRGKSAGRSRKSTVLTCEHPG